jgi:phosphoglycolate phosphatase
MEKKLIIFDFDGVIADGFPFGRKNLHSSYIELAEKYESLSRLKFEEFTIKNLIKSGIKLNPLKYPNFLKDLFHIYKRKKYDLILHEGIDEVVKSLAGKEYLITIASYTFSNVINWFLKKHLLQEHFIKVLGPNHNLHKYHNLLKLMKTFKVKPENTVLITDTVIDLKQANRAGIKTIAVSYGHGKINDLKEEGFNQLVHAPSDILKAIEKIFNTNINNEERNNQGIS